MQIKFNLRFIVIQKLVKRFSELYFGFLKVDQLSAYPKSPDALNVIHAHAKCSIEGNSQFSFPIL